eukprot:GHVT01088176.1.p1 GENE.GHVT01088176.1~~GHVT01088176.1.p1  ORF type:complete len:295 (+),score=75.20 GHVT01088176.1:172-1056(+)
MARNAERANAMLNKWLSMKSNIVKGVQMHRPRDSTECTDVTEAERWRAQVIREVTRKVAEIQNAGLGEHRIRDLNDEINRLLKEKTRWEYRIIEVGGPDYRQASQQLVDAHGESLSGSSASAVGGYRYFGAARDLPGVRELFEQESIEKATRKTRAQLLKGITPEYYGWRDEEDGELLLAEQLKEAELMAEAESEVREEEREKVQRLLKALASHQTDEASHTSASSACYSGQDDLLEYKAYVEVPSAADIKEQLLQKKKEALLQKYVTPSSIEQEKTAREMSGADPGEPPAGSN